MLIDTARRIKQAIPEALMPTLLTYQQTVEPNDLYGFKGISNPIKKHHPMAKTVENNRLFWAGASLPCVN